MPIIRYDTGDMVVYEETESGHPYVSSIYGRRMDTIFDTKGKIVSPHILYGVGLWPNETVSICPDWTEEI